MANEGAAPAADEGTTIVVHPGDVVQVTPEGHQLRGAFAIVEECHGWGLGVQLVAIVGGVPSKSYERLKPGQFAVIGPATLISPEIAGARRDSIRHAEELARDRARGA
jgi:hypothetical protein